MELKENTWMQHLVAVNTYRQCNSITKQTFRQNAPLHLVVFVLQKPGRTFHLHPMSPCTTELQDFPTQPSSGSNCSQVSISWSHSATVARPIHRFPDMVEEETLPLMWEDWGRIAFPQQNRDFACQHSQCSSTSCVSWSCTDAEWQQNSHLVAHSVSCVLCRY